MRYALLIGIVVTCMPARDAVAQTSSLGERQRQLHRINPPKLGPREASKKKINPVYERYSWSSVTPLPPKTFGVNDLITIVVRHRSKFEADSVLDTKKEWDIKTQLDAFFKFTTGGLGATTFQRGNPNVDFKFANRLKSDGEKDREDRLDTRITSRVIDVKPNGNLVLEGRGWLGFDDEASTITITGEIRKNDVTPDNTVLSTQIGDLRIDVNNDGAIRDASRRGWIPRMIDWLRPI